MRVLVIEDDRPLRDTLSQALRLAGFGVDAVEGGAQADAALDCGDYDVVVLDLGLPDIDGLHWLSRLRARGDRTPVLVLTARDDVAQRVLGLRSGADDYLTKPFALPELEARIDALIRRASGTPVRLCLQQLSFDPATRQAWHANQVLALSQREAALLEALMKRPGEVAIKSRLARQWSDWDSELGANAIEVCVHRLRRKLEPLGFRIRTLHGLGYLLESGDGGVAAQGDPDEC